MTKPKLLISACLFGEPCRYDGKSSKIDLTALSEHFELIPICPEVLGTLSTPRTPAEISGERVITKDGKDVTKEFAFGAAQTLSVAERYKIKAALLKAKSPSCGKGEVYDGTFSGTLVAKNGITADLLLSHGINVYTEKEIELLFTKEKRS